jgi:hypothetical protein
MLLLKINTSMIEWNIMLLSFSMGIIIVLISNTDLAFAVIHTPQYNAGYTHTLALMQKVEYRYGIVKARFGMGLTISMVHFKITIHTMYILSL